ncbi:tetratricopeptide repeat protein [Nocardiopsis ganjiahuensis]|uniref:hypothetical protein n=1 Tax=Nocardiopsis ganjiahuensis TaxID=239984 RepID=UPI000349F1A3|nr:hypothetical protein [Nocardiopsis ganjiahuensis]
MRGVVLDDLRDPTGTGDPGFDRRVREVLDGGPAEDAGELYEEAVGRFGADHHDALTLRVHTALRQERQGDPAGAAIALSGAAGQLSDSVGPLHPHMLALQAETARLWGECDLTDLAADSYERLAETTAQARGADNPGALAAYERFSWWTGKTDRVGRAVEAYTELLTRQRRALGPNHEDVLETRTELIRWHAQAGDPTGAARACADQVAARARVHGPDHPDTLAARVQLVRWCSEAGDEAGAVRACAELLAARELSRPPHHREVLNTRRLLARHRIGAGDLLAAERDYEELLPDLERHLPVDHRLTLLARADHARLMFLLGETDTAKAGIEERIEDLERVLGAGHESTVTARFLLAATRVTVGDLEGAVTEAEALLPELSERYGDDHHTTLFARAHVLEARGDSAAIGLYRELCERWTPVLGPTHPNVLLVRLRLATEGDLGKDGRRHLSALFEEFRRALGSTHGLTVMFRALLITLRSDEATALAELGDLYRTCAQTLGPDAPGTRAALEAYTEWRELVLGDRTRRSA